MWICTKSTKGYSVGELNTNISNGFPKSFDLSYVNGVLVYVVCYSGILYSKEGNVYGLVFKNYAECFKRCKDKILKVKAFILKSLFLSISNSNY